MTDGETKEVEGARAAVAILKGYFPDEDQQERVRERLVDLLEQEFRTAGLPVPKWVGRMREEPWGGLNQ